MMPFKFNTSLIVMSGALSLTLGLASAHLVAGSLKPVGSETFTTGATAEISWTQTVAHDGKYDIYYSKDGGTNWVKFVASQQFSKSGNTKVTYSWTVPSEATTTGMIRVCQLGQSNPECIDPTYTLKSAVFTITAAGTAINEVAKSPMGSSLKVNLSARGIEGSYSLTETQKVTLQAIKPDGRMIDALELGDQSAGSHSISWQPKGLQSLTGSVILRLKAGDKVLAESIQILQ